jgi:hypothetical protein
VEELATANARLASLAQTTTDSNKVLSQLLAAWPDDAGDPLRSLVQDAETIREALGELNENARKNLHAGINHSALGSEVQDHLKALESRLSVAQAEKPLTKDWIKEWNKTAQGLIQRLLEQPVQPPQPSFPEPPSGGGTPPQPPAPPITASAKLCEKRLNPTDPNEVSDFLADVRRALAELGDGSIRVALVREEGDE